MRANADLKLTVIMTVYNQEKYLARALDYLLEQKNQQFKLLVIDDGSTDSTAEIAASYQDRFQAFDLVSKANEGVAAARNLGLDMVDTPYLFFTMETTGLSQTTRTTLSRLLTATRTMTW